MTDAGCPFWTPSFFQRRRDGNKNKICAFKGGGVIGGREGYRPKTKRFFFPWEKPLLIFAVGVECGENRGRTGGEPGENRGRPKEPGENRGHLGREPGENRGLLAFTYKEYRGRSGGIWEENRGRTGVRNFLWNKRPNSGPENQRTGPPVKISRSHGIESRKCKFRRLKNYQYSTERQKLHQNLAPVLVIILGKSLVFYRKIITSTGFYRYCASEASAPVVVINHSPILLPKNLVVIAQATGPY